MFKYEQLDLETEYKRWKQPLVTPSLVKSRFAILT